MGPPLLWIHKTYESETHSHSKRREAANIRRHVQTTRAGLCAQGSPGLDKRIGDEVSVAPGCNRQVLSFSLRPNRYLGRITTSAVAKPHHKTTALEQSASKTRIKPNFVSGYAPASSCGTVCRGLMLEPAWIWPSFHPTERASLAFFECRTSIEWAGWQDGPFWSSVALPASHGSEAISRGLIALSAFHQSLETQDDGLQRILQQLSYRASSKAIESLREAKVSHFEAIVSCVLLLCLQNIRKDGPSFNLLRVGLQLVNKRRGWLSPDEEETIHTHVEHLFDRITCRFCIMSDPCAALMISISQRHTAISNHLLRPEPELPSSFMTLVEARNNLESILTWGHDEMARAQNLNPTETMHISISLKELRSTWEAALKATAERLTATDGTSMAKKTGNLLRVACIFGFIILESADTSKETTYDRHIADFQTIVQLLEDGTGHDRGHEISFGLDAGLIDIIAFVGCRCRDPLVRRRALDLLLRGNRVEGDRTARTPAAILKALISLEEQSCVVSTFEDVPETSRYRLLRGYQIFRENSIEVFFVSSPYDPALGARIKKVEVPLDQSSLDTHEGHDGIRLPDVIFGPGFAHFLEDSGTQQFVRLKLHQFHFPIPRV